MTTTAAPRQTGGAQRSARPDRIAGREWAVLLVLCGAIFMEGIDVSMMGVALPAIRADLGLSTASLQWVVSAYVLGYGGFVLLGGRAADTLGRRRMFLLWLLVFIAFSGLGGLAGEGWLLVVARFVTGVAAAFLAPAGLSIITTTFPEGALRNRAVLVYAGAGAGGFSLGLVAGGLLAAVDWRWVFFAPVVVASLLLAAAVRLLPRDGRPAVAAGFDVAGALTSTAGMVLVVLAVVQAHEAAPLRTAGVLALGLALLGAFLAVERRSPAPLLRLGLLRSAPLLRANAGAALLVGSFVGFQFVAVLYLQEVRDWSELRTGLALLVVGSDAVLAPTVTPLLVNRFGNRAVAAVGLALAALAYALFLPVRADWGYGLMLPSLVLLGLAFALAYGPLTIAATDGVAEQEQGVASGVLTTSFQFGTALGLAATTAVIVAGGASGDASAQLDGLRTALFVPLAAAVAGVAVVATGRRPRAHYGDRDVEE
jgi:MFS family permease